MLILGVNPGHDGALAVVRDGELVGVVESEKDSFRRHSPLTVPALLQAAPMCESVPDIVALGGWFKDASSANIGMGYMGVEEVAQKAAWFFGRKVRIFTSSHERSHIMCAVGLSPETTDPAVLATVLVWEGGIGSFYRVDSRGRVIQTIRVLTQPGARYAFLFALADPSFPDAGGNLRLGDSGKLMALASYGDPAVANRAVRATVDAILELPGLYPAPKESFRQSPLYNAGVTSDVTKVAAALLSRRLFRRFADVAHRAIPAGTPLFIAGGCGLNCHWNAKWRGDGHFSSVFVPPCANDSGSAVGTAIDAYSASTGNCSIRWNVYCGQPFELDMAPDASNWTARPANPIEIATALACNRVFAWADGRCELGPRALGNRSLLAAPFDTAMRDRLNAVKQREDYRPIAPCVRIEDAGRFFDDGFEDPYMLYSRQVRSPCIPAVTHVDGSARVQTVSQSSNQGLYELLSAFSAQTGVGVLCNTSLNFKGHGFINRTSDLIAYCTSRGIDDMVIDGFWFSRVAATARAMKPSRLEP